MKQYIITIISAALLCGTIHLLTPDSWVKYIKIITGIIILSVITTPLAKITKINLFSDFSLQNQDINENVQFEAVCDELKKRVEDDINERIKTEFSKDATSEVSISVNENYEITGVGHIKIKTDADKNTVVKRMCEVYGINEDEVEIYEP